MPKMPVGYDEACYAIGQVAIAWSMAERSFSACVLRLFHVYGQRHDPNPPISLKRQLKFFRKSLPAIGITPEQIAQGNLLANMIGELSQKRHWCIHGLADALIDRQIGDAITFARYEKTGSAATEVKTFAMSDLDDIRHQAWVLGGAFLFFFGQALGGLPKEQLDEMLSKLGS